MHGRLNAVSAALEEAEVVFDPHPRDLVEDKMWLGALDWRDGLARLDLEFNRNHFGPAVRYFTPAANQALGKAQPPN